MNNILTYGQFVNEASDKLFDVFSHEFWFDAAETGDIGYIIKHINYVDINKQDDDGYTALMLASHRSKLDVVEYLVKKGANVNIKTKDNTTALNSILTFRYNDVVLDIAKILLDAGADADVRMLSSGDTILMRASSKGYTDLVELLVKYGADVNAKNNINSDSLMMSIINGHIDISYFLINNGADVNTVDNGGCSPLYYACMFDRYSVIKNLINNVADISIIAKNGNDIFSHELLFKDFWQDETLQEAIITKQPWNIKFFDDRIGFLPELKVKYKDAFIISDLNI